MPRIDARFCVLRGGVPLLELAGNADQPATVAFAGDADIKMTFSGTFDNLPGEVNFLTDRLAPSLRIDGVEYPLGVYVITTPTQSKNGDLVQCELTGYDLTYLAQLSRLEERAHYSKGTKYLDVVRNLNHRPRVCDVVYDCHVFIYLAVSDKPSST